jgi:hypothetical protein
MAAQTSVTVSQAVAGKTARSTNLEAMHFDNAARARIARGWLNSSLDQPTYAAKHGISERTLRDWVSRYGAGRRPHIQLRSTIVATIEHLQNILAALHAECGVARGRAARVDDDGRDAHQVVITGESYRTRATRRRAAEKNTGNEARAQG